MKFRLPLWGFEIAELISQYNSMVYKSLLGIFSIDQCPKDIPFMHFCVINEAPSNSDGVHWLVRYIFQ